MESRKLNMILDKDASGTLQAWACRGEGKGCTRNKFRSRAKHCDDCMGPLPDDMTLAEVEERVRKGDA